MCDMLIIQLPNHLFDKLAIDVYDEVDRRENNTSKFIKIDTQS